MAKSISFKATFGINAGYGHDNANNGSAAAVVAKAWQEVAAEVFAATEIYISAVVGSSLTVYHTDWGCPEGGETTAAVHGEANPAFTENTEAWKEAVIEVCRLVKERLEQSTVAVSFSSVDDFVYLTND